LDEPAVELPSPVDPDAQPYETGEGQLFGRFGFESLGVAIAFDAAPAMFFVDTPPSDQEVVFGARGLHPTFLRPVGLRADGSRPLSADTPTISFDEWLAIWSDEMGIIDDTTTIVGGRDARAITFLPPNGSDLDTQRFKLHDRELLLNDRWPTRIVRVDLDDPNPPFMWLELHDAVGTIEAEGVIGGISGSCVLDEEGRVAGVVHANGFSRIDGTTNTWAKVVPIRAAILEAQGVIDLSTATALADIDPAAIPKIETGRYGLLGGAE